MKRRDLIFGKETNSPRVLSTLEQYSGIWDASKAAHLLRRTTFGAIKSDLDEFVKSGMIKSIEKILEPLPEPSKPIDPQSGTSWTSESFDPLKNGLYTINLKSWLYGLILSRRLNISEKITLFWHNHFATETAGVGDARLMYKQNALLRSMALGNIKTLVKELTKDPSMLRYLNGNTNTAGKPNENYAREFFELFTIGKGKEISQGNYTNYTEQDIQAAARVLTGWKDDRINLKTVFQANKHDIKDKQFSAAFNNTIIKGRSGDSAGDLELDDLINMVFAVKETSKYICRKIYRWFVFYEIDSFTEENIIDPLSEILISNGFEIKPVISTLLKSEHFFDDNNIGIKIKDPADYIATLLHGLNFEMPDESTNLAAYYQLGQSAMLTSSTLQMNVLDPPDVAGWPALYQTPDYQRLWINSVTLPYRNGYSDAAIYGQRPFSKTFMLDVIKYVKDHVSAPSDAKTVIIDISNNLLVLPLTNDQVAYLLENVFLPGLPDYEWTEEWLIYESNPNDNKNKNLIIAQLSQLIRFICRMAEYQLM